ncbi:MAG: dihydrofolate reductase family protein [Nitrososphaerales archaeon]
MRKLIIDSIISLDSYYTDPNNSIDWFDFDDGEQEWSKEILRRVDTMIYGRRTYEEFSEFWPTPQPETMGFDSFLIQRLRELPKIVFSRSLPSAPWKPSTIVRENPGEAISKMKKESGKDLVVVGSGSVVNSLVREGLVDEYRIRVRPIILGAGKQLFSDRNARHPLKLVSSKQFDNGVIGLHYEPILHNVTAPY